MSTTCLDTALLRGLAVCGVCTTIELIQRLPLCRFQIATVRRVILYVRLTICDIDDFANVVHVVLLAAGVIGVAQRSTKLCICNCVGASSRVGKLGNSVMLYARNSEEHRHRP